MREHLPDGRLDWSARTRRELTTEEKDLVAAYMDAHERLDMDGLAALLREDLRFAMPPQPGIWMGRDHVVQSWLEGGFGSGEYVDWRCRLTVANGQPAVAMYLRRPRDTVYRAFTLDVLRIADGKVAEITTFDADLFPAFDLPAVLAD
jgi:RNA polymerase sigma-70 factor (ECF subfamily)